MKNVMLNGKIRLIIAILLITIVWGVALPHMASYAAIESRLEFLEQNGIDPSAMFYTELDAMDPILERLEQTSTKK